MKTATDDELVEIASVSEGGGGAIVEAMRRLRLATEASIKSNEYYARRLAWLTLVLVVLTILLTIPAIREVRDWLR